MTEVVCRVSIRLTSSVAIDGFSIMSVYFYIHAIVERGVR